MYVFVSFSSQLGSLKSTATSMFPWRFFSPASFCPKRVDTFAPAPLTHRPPLRFSLISFFDSSTDSEDGVP